MHLVENSTINVLANGSDVDADALKVTSASVAAAQGTISINLDGTLLFTPAANFHGTATIDYAIADTTTGTAVAKVPVAVSPLNEDPMAVDDAMTKPEDQAITFAVLANHTKVENDTLAVTSATVPAAQGTVAIEAPATPMRV